MKTEAGAARAAQDERERMAAERQKADALRAAKNNLAGAAVALGRRAFLWSLASFVICLVPGFIACALAWKARDAARRAGMATPPAANRALVISGINFALLAGFVVFAVTDDQRVTREKTQLVSRIGAKDKGQTLDHETACDMVHLRLLEQGYAGTGGNLISNFDCPGEISHHGEASMIDDVRFQTSSSGPARRAFACFKREDRWLVDAIQDTECAFAKEATAGHEGGEARGGAGATANAGASKIAAAHHHDGHEAHEAHDAGAMVHASLAPAPSASVAAAPIPASPPASHAPPSETGHRGRP